jgi:hypothetical protein
MQADGLINIGIWIFKNKFIRNMTLQVKVEDGRRIKKLPKNRIFIFMILKTQSAVDTSRKVEVRAKVCGAGPGPGTVVQLFRELMEQFLHDCISTVLLVDGEAVLVAG